MKLFIVGQIVNEKSQPYSWEFQGVFDNVEKAEAACKNRLYFVGPATLNKSLPDESIPWPDCYFPNHSNQQ